MKKRVLVVEDEVEIARLVELHLVDLGCEVSVVHDGTTAMESALGCPWNLVILDLMLPDMDGLEICRRLRESRRYTPVLILTSKSSEMDRVLGLEVGADDYLTKPFSIRELMARTKALFRRAEAFRDDGADHGEVIAIHDLVIDPTKRKVTRRGEAIHLTVKEFDLLLQFARQPGRVYSRGELLDLVWGYGYGGYEHTVNSHINRLRSKVEDSPDEPRYVLTVWGVGYKFREAEERGDE